MFHGSSAAVMRSVGTKHLKSKLSEYIRLAAGGETVLITDRDRVVAELGPPAPGRSPSVSDALLSLVLRSASACGGNAQMAGPATGWPRSRITRLRSRLCIVAVETKGQRPKQRPLPRDQTRSSDYWSFRVVAAFFRIIPNIPFLLKRLRSGRRGSASQTME